MKKLHFVLIIIFLLPINAYGVNDIDRENVVLITKSNSMNDVVFDGKWTFYTEWKNTSYDLIKSDGVTEFHLRSAHQDNFVYFMIDVVSDEKANFGNDQAIICIDSKNNKSSFIDDDDYCFVVKLQELNFFEKLFGENYSYVVKGKTYSVNFDELEKIELSEFIGIGTMSDNEDRYSLVPHASYEYKIPIDLIGRSDSYGLYVAVYDADLDITYSWPKSIITESSQIPKPYDWGNLISPDKTLPEFNLGIVLLLSIIPIVFISYFRKNTNFRV